jgi:hypothetical protein
MENVEKIVLRNTTVDEDELLMEIDSLKGVDSNKLLTRIELMTESKEIDLRFLEEKYNEVLQSGNDNEYFITGFKLREDMAITINEHIYLYRIISHERLQSPIKWYYVDQKLYIADSWWETDEEILNDVHSLSFVDFFIKYKAFGWFKKSNLK